MSAHILRDSEARALARALAEGSGAAGFTEADLDALLRLAEETRFVGSLLKLVVRGRVVVRRGADDEWEWKRRTQATAP